MRRKLIRWWLERRRFTVAPQTAPTFAGAMSRLRALRLNIGTILDVGASTGCWTKKAIPYFSEAKFLCVEAQSVHEPALQRFTRRHPNGGYVMAAAGAREGEIYFDIRAPFGGVASEQAGGPGWARVPVTTLDRLAAQHGLPSPFLIKLDTHGFEVPILDGACAVLERTAVLIIEVYNFQISPDALMFPKMCEELARRGFRCFDLFDPMNRPADGALWQMDMVFLRGDRPEFQRNAYQ